MESSSRTDMNVINSGTSGGALSSKCVPGQRSDMFNFEHERERERKATDEQTSLEVYGKVWERQTRVQVDIGGDGGGNNIESTVLSAVSCIAAGMGLGQPESEIMNHSEAMRTLAKNFENFKQKRRKVGGNVKGLNNEGIGVPSRMLNGLENSQTYTIHIPLPPEQVGLLAFDDCMQMVHELYPLIYVQQVQPSFSLSSPFQGDKSYMREKGLLTTLTTLATTPLHNTSIGFSMYSLDYYMKAFIHKAIYFPNDNLAAGLKLMQNKEKLESMDKGQLQDAFIQHGATDLMDSEKRDLYVTYSNLSSETDKTMFEEGKSRYRGGGGAEILVPVVTLYQHCQQENESDLLFRPEVFFTRHHQGGVFKGETEPRAYRLANKECDDYLCRCCEREVRVSSEMKFLKENFTKDNEPMHEHLARLQVASCLTSLMTTLLAEGKMIQVESYTNTPYRTPEETPFILMFSRHLNGGVSALNQGNPLDVEQVDKSTFDQKMNDFMGLQFSLKIVDVVPEQLERLRENYRKQKEPSKYVYPCSETRTDDLFSRIRTAIRVPEDCKTLTEAVERMGKNQHLTTIVVGKDVLNWEDDVNSLLAKGEVQTKNRVKTALERLKFEAARQKTAREKNAREKYAREKYARERAALLAKFQVGCSVTWTKSDSEIPRGTPGVIQSILEKYEVQSGEMLAKVEFPKGTWNFPLTELETLTRERAALLAKLQVDCHVTWTKSDSDVPSGTIGIIRSVLVSDSSEKASVEFPKGTWQFNLNELEPSTGSFVRVPEDCQSLKAAVEKVNAD